jgi:hypothetical protein
LSGLQWKAQENEMNTMRINAMPKPPGPGDLPPAKPVPGPAPGWLPDVPVEEPEPDLLPDEWPNPNPDETRNPPVVEPGRGI